MKAVYDCATLCRSGGREYNEDCIQIQEKEGQYLFVLADGLGGMGGGKVASELAVKSIVELFSASPGAFSLDEAVQTAQAAVLSGRKAHPEAEKMSTTLVLLWIRDGVADWIHIGDSRLYLFRKGQVYAVTEDHSVPQMLVKMGEITPDQIRHHQDRNRLLRTLGWEQDGNGELPKGHAVLKEEDAFLLCSDGFWELITEEEMALCLNKAKDSKSWLSAMRRIVEKNGRNSNMDNYSAICVLISKKRAINPEKEKTLFETGTIGRANGNAWKYGLIIFLAIILCGELFYIFTHLM